MRILGTCGDCQGSEEKCEGRQKGEGRGRSLDPGAVPGWGPLLLSVQRLRRRSGGPRRGCSEVPGKALGAETHRGP